MLMVDVGSRDLQESYIGAKGQAAVASSRADEAADFRNLMRPRAKDACGWHRDERKHCTGPAEGRLCLRQGCWFGLIARCRMCRTTRFSMTSVSRLQSQQL